MKRLLAPIVVLVLVAVGAVVAIAAQPGETGTRQSPILVIRPEVVGCHSWSLNGGTYQVEHTLRMREGDSLQIVNRDICTHTLVKTAGGSVTLGNFETETPNSLGLAENASDVTALMHAARMPIFPEPSGEAAPPPEAQSVTGEQAAATGAMTHWGAGVEVRFDEAGSYHFVTEEGAGYFPDGVRTIGPDNTLTLHVLVYAPIHHPLP